MGLEDNLYISRGKPASGNAELVEHAAGIIKSVGEQVATVDQACELLGLHGKSALSKKIGVEDGAFRPV